MTPKYKLERVQWHDSYGCSPSWEAISDIEAANIHCWSVGWIIHETDELIVICPHIHTGSDNSDPQGCGEMTIPKVAIVSRETLIS